jgi:hypothetical protein
MKPKTEPLPLPPYALATIAVIAALVVGFAIGRASRKRTNRRRRAL